MKTSVYRLQDVFINFDYLRKPLSSMEREKFKGEYPYYGAQGIIDYVQTYRCDGEYLLIAEDGENLMSRSQPLALIANGQFWVNNHAHIVKTNDLADLRYVCYALNHLDITGYVTGSAQPKLSQGNLNKIKMTFPTVEYQQRIVSVLSAYDNLIEVNNKRIKVLEQMAENLYQEWFVRFRFPSHETAEFIDSRLGRIPTSFKIVKMKDVFEYYIGGGWGNDDENDDFSVPAYVIRGTDFPRVSKGDLSSCPLRYHKKSNYTARELKEDDIILEVSGGTAEQPVGRTLLITEDTINRLDGKVICASFCKQIRVKKEVVSPIFFYYWMQFLYETRIIDRFQLQSTGIINFQFEFFLRKGDVLLPSKELMTKFDMQIRYIYNEISAMAKQNDNLIKQRDLLLPRLMSGKLEV